MPKNFLAPSVNFSPGVRADILRALGGGPKNVAGVAAALGRAKSGHISTALETLEESGFVSADEGVNPDTGAPMQQKRYRLSDNYARFYLRYIEPALKMIGKGAYAFASLEQLEGWDSVMGLAFENLVVNNFRELLPRLGLDRSLLLSAAPFRRKDLQVDLLLQTSRSLCLVEVKRRKEIGREVVADMAGKIEKIGKQPGKSLKTALVYCGSLHPSIEAEGYFNALIDIRSLLT